MIFFPELMYQILSFIACTAVKVHSRDLTGLYSEDERKAKDTLLVCSLVSRTWRENTLPYLFHTIAMYCEPRGDHPSNPAHHRHRHLPDFLAFLTASPRIGPYIKELRLFQSPPDGVGGSVPRRPQPWASLVYDALLVAKIIDRLPCLCVLYLRDLGLRACGGPAVQKFGHQRTLHRLECAIVDFHLRGETTMDGLLDLLSIFSNVKALNLYGVELNTTSPEGSSEPFNLDLSSLGLETLCLVNCTAVDTFVRTFRPALASMRKPVTTLELSCLPIPVSNADGQKELWRIICSSLVNITLDLTKLSGCSAYNIPRIINDFDVAHCTGLACATFNVIVWGESNLDEPWARDMGPTMSRLLACPSLRELTLRVLSCGVAPDRLRLAYPNATQEIDDALLKLHDKKIRITVLWRDRDWLRQPGCSATPEYEDYTAELFPRLI